MKRTLSTSSQPQLPLSPKLKRKKSEIDIVLDDNVATDGESSNASPVSGQVPGSEDDEDEVVEIDEDVVDDIIGAAELQQDRADTFGLLSKEEAEGLRSRLREIGVEAFFQETLVTKAYSPQKVATAFGLSPDLPLSDDDFLLLLNRAVVRFLRKRQKLTQYNTIDDAASLLADRRNIMIITGAGISTSLGIPDFRSKDTGFYSKLLKMGISEPEEVFDIFNFDERPETFYELAADILPNGKAFTPTHGFIRLLQDKGKLQTNYTQNIDDLESNAGIDRSRLVQCHGSFARATCRQCKAEYPGESIFEDMRAKRVAYCPRCVEALKQYQPANKRKSIKKHNKKHDWSDSESDLDDDIPKAGVLKPNITFFGEKLPDFFFDRFLDRDQQAVDLVIVIGTSMKVAPVSEMPDHVPKDVPQIYISREPCEHINFDVQLLGDCDTVVWELCRRAGYELEHSMLNQSLETKVTPVEGKECRWYVKAESATT